MGGSWDLYALKVAQVTDGQPVIWEPQVSRIKSQFVCMVQKALHDLAPLTFLSNVISRLLPLLSIMI